MGKMKDMFNAEREADAHLDDSYQYEQYKKEQSVFKDTNRERQEQGVDVTETVQVLNDLFKTFGEIYKYQAAGHKKSFDESENF